MSELIKKLKKELQVALQFNDLDVACKLSKQLYIELKKQGH